MSFSVTANHAGNTHTVGGASDGEAGRRCALGFNPSGHVPTDAIKTFCAGAMAAVIKAREETPKPMGSFPQAEKAAYADAMRCFAHALTLIEDAQMAAVKGLHTRANAGVNR